MNTVRIGVIAIWAAVGASGYLSLRGAATREAQPVQANRASTQASRAPSASFAAPGPARRAEHSAEVRTVNPAGDPAFEPDASALARPTQTTPQVFDALNADIGPEGEYVDPEALAAMLRSDPELGRLLNE